MSMKEKKLGSRTVFQGRIFDVLVDDVQLPSGRQTTREIVRHAGAVGLVPVLDDGRIVLEEQYRHPAGEILVEIPAGRLEERETPDQTARRELLEETGYLADEIKRMTVFYTTPGYTSEKLHLYVARGLKKAETKPDFDENITLREVAIDEALRLIGRGEIKDGKTIAGLLYYRTFLLSE
jgi:ADP-ribose pyrophosphatase